MLSLLHVVAPDVGCGFGGKASLYQEEIVVAVVASHLGRAVRWTGDRPEDLASASQGFDEIVDAQLALDKDGRILALGANAGRWARPRHRSWPRFAPNDFGDHGPLV